MILAELEQILDTKLILHQPTPTSGYIAQLKNFVFAQSRFTVISTMFSSPYDIVYMLLCEISKHSIEDTRDGRQFRLPYISVNLDPQKKKYCDTKQYGISHTAMIYNLDHGFCEVCRDHKLMGDRTNGRHTIATVTLNDLDIDLNSI